jgi:hypothetical protein
MRREVQLTVVYQFVVSNHWEVDKPAILVITTATFQKAQLRCFWIKSKR